MQLHVVKVFVGPDGRGGNPLGVFLRAGSLPAARRQAIAADLGFSETVFVTDRDRATLRIHTPAVELALAGHPLVGTAWLLAHEGTPVPVLRPPAGHVRTWSADGRTWISARPEWGPTFDFRHLATPADVDDCPGGEPDRNIAVWAWADEPAGVVRARVFVDDAGIAEDEATGSAALRLGQLLDRTLTIRQGVGSELLVRPGSAGEVAVGGRVDWVEARSYPDADPANP